MRWKGSAKHYHISWDYKKVINVFVPRIPVSALPTENITVPRVSICKNLKECLNGIGYTTNYMFMESYKKLDTEYIPLRAYEFELTEDEVLDSEEIVKYLPDALRTKELWTVNEIKPIKSYIILPTFLHQEDNYTFDIVEFEYEDEEGIRDLEINIDY